VDLHVQVEEDVINLVKILGHVSWAAHLVAGKWNWSCIMSHDFVRVPLTWWSKYSYGQTKLYSPQNTKLITSQDLWRSATIVPSGHINVLVGSDHLISIICNWWPA
jgi:hypothetical protein